MLKDHRATKSNEEELNCFVCTQPLDRYKALVHSGTSDTAIKVHAYCLEKWVTLCLHNSPWSTPPCPVCRGPLGRSEEPIDPIPLPIEQLAAFLTTQQLSLQAEHRYAGLRAWGTNHQENSNLNAQDALLELRVAYLLTSGPLFSPLYAAPHFPELVWDEAAHEMSPLARAAQLLANIGGTADDLYNTVDRITLAIRHPEVKWPLIGKILIYLRNPYQDRYADLQQRYVREYCEPSVAEFERGIDP